MADVISEFRTYIGISDSTIVDGVTPTITVAVPEFEPLDAGDIGEDWSYPHQEGKNNKVYLFR